MSQREKVRQLPSPQHQWQGVCMLGASGATLHGRNRGEIMHGGQGERVKHRMHDVSCIFFGGFSDLRFRVILGLRVNPKHRLAHNGGPTCHDQLEKPKKHRHARGILPRAKPGLLKYICGRRHALLSTGQRHKAQKAGVPAKNRMQGVQCMPCKHGEICEDR